MLLDSFTLNVGNIGGAQFPVRFAMNSPSLPSRPSGFVRKLLGLRDKFVLLWDEQDKRGWLIDGLSALLHLVRASLKTFSNDEISRSCFKLNVEEIQEPNGSYPDAAFHFFIDGQTIHDNMKLEMYPDVDNENPYLLIHHVYHLAELLQDVIDQQEKACGYDGIKIRPHLRKHLQGWDFVDIAGASGPFRPRETRLNTFGKAWVDLVRSINAVTLFGQGYGDIILPAKDSCSQLNKVPTGQYYIAACTSTLRRIMEIHGDPTSMRLSESIVWYDPNNTLRQCTSNPKQTSAHLDTDYTQVIWPKRLEKLLVKRATVSPLNTGAMIFGHSTIFPRFWPDIGDPTETARQDDEVDSESCMYDRVLDSGIHTIVSTDSSSPSTSNVTQLSSIYTPPSTVSTESLSPTRSSPGSSMVARLRLLNLPKLKRK